uniref:Sulfotransferase n=1 Tax=Cyprinus carpio TaxID=7962 RepID=A0A8C2AF50_CYPCA
IYHRNKLYFNRYSHRKQTHCFFSHLIQCVFFQILVLFRNPKDMLVSYYHFMNKNPFFSDFMAGEVAWGSYFDHALTWEKRLDDPNVMMVTYEELKQNLSEDVKKISAFFNLPLTDEQVSSIAGGSTFSKKKKKKSLRWISDQTNSNMYPKIPFLHTITVGDWKNHFSYAQSKQMDELFQAKLAGTNLRARLKYDLYCQ